jgi:hypothetical protein
MYIAYATALEDNTEQFLWVDHVMTFVFFLRSIFECGLLLRRPSSAMLCLHTRMTTAHRWCGPWSTDLLLYIACAGPVMRSHLPVDVMQIS